MEILNLFVVIFLALQVTGVIDNWWVVFSPWMIGVGIYIVLFIFEWIKYVMDDDED